MITSTGKPILHTDLILAFLEALQLPLQIAVCKCAAHTSGDDTHPKSYITQCTFDIKMDKTENTMKSSLKNPAAK